MVRFTFFLNYEYTYIHTHWTQEEKSGGKCQEFKVHFPEILPFPQPSNRSFPECQEFQWYILETMTPAHRHWATNKKEASKSGKTCYAPTCKGFPKTIKRDSDRWKGPGSSGEMYWSEMRTEPGS